MRAHSLDISGRTQENRLRELVTQTIRKKVFHELFPEDYLDLINAPTKLFHPYRLLIMQTLKFHGNVEFRQLRHNVPDITDGNLASHLRVLENLGYICYHKEVVDRKLRTSYEITEVGRKAFNQLINSLKKVIEHEPEI